LKISKELKTGVIAVVAIALLVAGVNFLKGNSFFGGDDKYYAYFPNSGQLATASNVTLNGVIVGKVLNVEYVPTNPLDRKVKVTFSIQNKDVQLPVGSTVEIGSLDLFSKGMMIMVGADLSKGFLKPGAVLPGRLAVDMMSQVKSYADPISQKVQAMMTSIDKMVTSVSAFWDATATSEIEKSMKEVKIAIERIGNVAKEVELLVGEERIKFARIMNNVESITSNLKRSNDEVTAIVGNTKKITDDMVTADFKGVISNASETLKTFNEVLGKAKNGEGTLGKLIGDDKLFNELVNTNKELQELVEDIQAHPERYIHFSVFGAKNKGVPLSPAEEQKLHELLDSTTTN
jgi:phospholipid/cholesterol/gamma-HCH transport system substrate-binding protein